MIRSCWRNFLSREWSFARLCRCTRERRGLPWFSGAKKPRRGLKPAEAHLAILLGTCDPAESCEKSALELGQQHVQLSVCFLA